MRVIEGSEIKVSWSSIDHQEIWNALVKFEEIGILLADKDCTNYSRVNKMCARVFP